MSAQAPGLTPRSPWAEPPPPAPHRPSLCCLGLPASLGRIPQSVRILGSLIAILLVFLTTAILVKVQLDAVPFFIITMVKIVFINCEQGWEETWARDLPTSPPPPLLSDPQSARKGAHSSPWWKWMLQMVRAQEA